MRKATVRNLPVKGKKVLVRVDFNVPLQDGVVRDDTRIRASLPTIRYLLDKGARVILMSHLGRPGGQVVEEQRLDPAARRLGELLGRKVIKVNSVAGEDAAAAASALQEGEIMMLENIRFEPGEEKNDPGLAEKLASLGDFYVNDAFGTAHRAHASTEGVTRFLRSAAGLLMEKEIIALTQCLENPRRPLAAVLGGAKVSDKIDVVKKFLLVTDYLIIGGGMANTFLAAMGNNMGASFYEAKKLDTARELADLFVKEKSEVCLPDDLIVTAQIKPGAECRAVPVKAVPSGEMAVDIGPATVEKCNEIVRNAGTIIWNGPLGVFETPPFHRGTEAVARAAVESEAYLLIGGGDTIFAFEQFGLSSQVDYISTGGGATLEFLGGAVLPGIAALDDLE